MHKNSWIEKLMDTMEKENKNYSKLYKYMKRQNTKRNTTKYNQHGVKKVF